MRSKPPAFTNIPLQEDKFLRAGPRVKTRSPPKSRDSRCTLCLPESTPGCALRVLKRPCIILGDESFLKSRAKFSVVRSLFPCKPLRLRHSSFSSDSDKIPLAVYCSPYPPILSSSRICFHSNLCGRRLLRMAPTFQHGGF